MSSVPSGVFGSATCTPSEQRAQARLADLRVSIGTLRREREALLAELRQVCGQYGPIEGHS